jgi:hypothetical protein
MLRIMIAGTRMASFTIGSLEGQAMAEKIEVCLTFDFDAMSVWIGTFHARSPSALSRGEFGNVGAHRLLTMLRDWRIPSTWFVPGHTAEAFPATVEEIARAGHEIGHHGYFHQRPQTPDDEARDFDRASAALERITGRQSIGYRSPAAGLMPSTLNCLLERNFLYDSSMMAQDFSPYYCRIIAASATRPLMTDHLCGGDRRNWSNCPSPGASTIF